MGVFGRGWYRLMIFFKFVYVLIIVGLFVVLLFIFVSLMGLVIGFVSEWM